MPISDYCMAAIKYTCMWTWWRRRAEVQSRASERIFTLNLAWLLVLGWTGWFEDSTNCRSIGIFALDCLWNFPKMETKISSEQQFFWWKYLVDVRGQRRTGRLQDRKATGTEISSHHNRAMQQHDKPWSRWAKASPKHNTRTRKNISTLDKLLSVVGASLTSKEFLKVQFEKFGLISDF